MKRFLAAIRFLTVLPLPGDWGAAESDLAGSVPFFPLVGLLLGGLAAAIAWGMARIAPPMVAAAVIVVAMLSFSGCLHLDGLSDTADGLLSSRNRQRMLEIMKDSHVGAMGVIAVACVLLLKFASLSSLEPARLWPAALLMPLAGRAAICVHLALLRPARTEGLGAVFGKGRRIGAALLAVALLAAAGWATMGVRGLAAAAASLIAAMLLAAYVQGKLGGVTGDTLGAACEIVEIVPAMTLTLVFLR